MRGEASEVCCQILEFVGKLKSPFQKFVGKNKFVGIFKSSWGYSEVRGEILKFVGIFGSSWGCSEVRGDILK